MSEMPVFHEFGARVGSSFSYPWPYLQAPSDRAVKADPLQRAPEKGMSQRDQPPQPPLEAHLRQSRAGPTLQPVSKHGQHGS